MTLIQNRRAARELTIDRTGYGIYRAWLNPTDNPDADKRAAIRAIRRAAYLDNGTRADTLATYYPHLRVRYVGTQDGRACYQEADA